MDRPIEKKRRGLKLFLGIVVIGGAILSAAYYFYSRDTGSKLNVKTDKIIVSKVSEDSFQEFIPILGTVMPVTTFYLDSIEGGRVEEKFIEEGAWVKKGDKILQLSNTNLVLNLMQREAEYFNQSDNLQKARLSLEQYRLNHATLLTDLDYQIKKDERLYRKNAMLFEKKMISRQQYFTEKDQFEYLLEKKRLAEKNFEAENRFRQVQIKQLEDSLKRMNSNLDIIKEKFNSLTITAPIAGQLTVLKAEIGESKPPGQRMGQINVMENLKVRVGIDEHYLNRIENGKIGTFEFDDKTSELEIFKIFPEVREGQFKVDMKFSKEVQKGIRIGQTLHIKLALGNLETAIVLPRGGFYQSTAGQWVYVLDDSGKFATKRTIRLGKQNSDVFVVLEGLKPGEKVITSNYDNYEKMDKLVLQ